MKRPLTKCQQAQKAFMDCRELLKQEQERCATAEALLKEARDALGEGAAVLRQAAAASRTERRLSQDVELYQRLQGGDVPWLIKDFNVLYRVAQRLLDTLPIEHAGETRGEAAAELRRQLERLKPAFTDTEEVRELMRSRQG